MKGIITVVLKQDILDPQGRAVMNSLQGLGYNEVQGVRIGKSIEIELNGISPDERYVVLANGFDFFDASPIHGLHLDSQNTSLDVSVCVQQ